jgi:hypothetical protein
MLSVVKGWLHRWMEKLERRYDYDMSYAHEMLDVSGSAFVRFALLAQSAQHRGGAPAAALFAAQLVGTLIEDCGPCTQLVAKKGEEAGVDAAILQAVLEADEAGMGSDAHLSWRFALAVLSRDAEADGLREEIVARWGRQAIVALALAIATARMFPTIKYVMGHGSSCQSVSVGGVAVRPAVRCAMARR